MSQISTLAENGKKSQAGLVGRGFQAVAGGVWVDLFYAKSSCLFLLNYCQRFLREGANKQVISSQADSLIKISRIWADFFPANTSNQPI
ncbi:hypothetical protein C3F39_16790 [Klebsiella pneumoniae]|nr:hypothetical protein C3F39_16790 [Klebsiella pneumoniae]